MNVHIRRYGIVIKSIPVSGEKASIGSGSDCDIVIDDPYLAAHVADLVKKPDGWHIVDAATSLEGVARDGNRIEDELVTGGAVYSVGGFELVAEGAAPAAAAGPQAERPAGMPPPTMADVAMPSGPPPTIAENVAIPRGSEIPKTMFEAPMPRAAAPAARPSGPAAQLVTPPRHAAPAAAPDNRRKRLLLIAGVFGALIVLMLILIVARGGKDEPTKVVTTETTATTATTVVKTETAPPVVAASDAAKLLSSLKYDEALAAWEAQLGKGPDPALAKRYADLALEIGRIQAASGAPNARQYFERVVKFGPADSAAVAEAKRRLATE